MDRARALLSARNRFASVPLQRPAGRLARIQCHLNGSERQQQRTRRIPQRERAVGFVPTGNPLILGVDQQGKAASLGGMSTPYASFQGLMTLTPAAS